MKRYIKGFTLIELLVVIAIIGILASVVLVSLNSARKKGNDSRVISDVQQIRTALESGYNGSGYPDLNGANAECTANASGNHVANATFSNCVLTTGPQFSTLNQLNTDANSQGGAIFIATNPGGTPTSYAIRGRLPSTSASYRYFCIDSSGATNQSDDGVTGAGAANWARCE